MKSTTPFGITTEEGLDGWAFDVGGLLECLERVTDHRCPKGVRYPLPGLLLVAALAKLAGEDNPYAIADWVRLRGRQLREALHLPWKGIPNHNTYRRVFQDDVDPQELDRKVSDYLRSLPGVGHSILVAFDGKTLRGTIDPRHPHGDHLLAAYLPEEGIVLIQLPTGSKENEISVASRLLKAVDLRGKVAMGDAAQTQRQLSAQILAAGGDYIWFAKDNQPSLRAEIEELFTADDTTVLGAHVPNDFRAKVKTDKGHGRLEVRKITTSSELKGYSDWPGLEQVFQLERRRVNLRTGREGREIVYGLTSLSAEEASPARLLDLSRSYWGIENGLHWRRDVTFREDRTRMTKGNLGRVMATLNNLAISLLRHAGATNIAAARRWCQANLIPKLSPAPMLE